MFYNKKDLRMMSVYYLNYIFVILFLLADIWNIVMGSLRDLLNGYDESGHPLLPSGFFESSKYTYIEYAVRDTLGCMFSVFAGLAIIKVYEVFGSKSVLIRNLITDLTDNNYSDHSLILKAKKQSINHNETSLQVKSEYDENRSSKESSGLYSQHTKENLEKAKISNKSSEILVFEKDENIRNSAVPIEKYKVDDVSMLILSSNGLCNSDIENNNRRFSKPLKKTPSSLKLKNFTGD